MSLTLRRLQKMFSAAARGVRVNDRADRLTLGRLGAFLSKRELSAATVTKDGGLVKVCSCGCGSKSSSTTVHDVRRMMDRWVRAHGPDALLEDILDAQQDQAPQGQDQQGQNQQGQGQQGQGQQDQDQQGQGQQGQSAAQSDQTQTTGPASGGTPTQTSQPAAKPQPSPQQKALTAAKDAMKDALTIAAKRAASKATAASMVRKAKKKLKDARRAASFNKVAESSGPSLSARQSIAQANGRLQRVPQKLRNRMAVLINRLVEQGGTTGENLSPIPVLSSTKLVKRMVVRRPLPNALKEDTVIGRPVVLFLPDVSPSCAAQAQVACDLANAAGYAGVSGSDVLVFPHSNGEVDSDEEYVPWFNGRPLITDAREVSKTFEDVCAGRSKFRVRVVVFLGDHDAVDRYGAIAGLRSVTRALWLHNRRVNTAQKRPVPAAPGMRPNWSQDAMEKLSMVAGCVDQSTMLTGFDMALRMR